jgi:hypothetical protein
MEAVGAALFDLVGGADFILRFTCPTSIPQSDSVMGQNAYPFGQDDPTPVSLRLSSPSSRVFCNSNLEQRHVEPLITASAASLDIVMNTTLRNL